MIFAFKGLFTNDTLSDQQLLDGFLYYIPNETDQRDIDDDHGHFLLQQVENGFAWPIVAAVATR